MRKALLIISVFIAGAAQCQFVQQGKITYERRVNQWANVQGSFADDFKKAMPEYRSDLFVLTFDENKSLYKAGSEIKKNFFNAPGNENIVYTDFNKDQFVASKSIFEKTFLIKDSLKKITWKIKDDFREIAGYNCRRATTILFDSVFVVAFYTDAITLPGGPEGFNGLPGTILGLVINRLHTTWYATKVEPATVEERKITPPVKGTSITQEELIQQLEKSMSSWGEMGQRIKWAVLI